MTARVLTTVLILFAIPAGSSMAQEPLSLERAVQEALAHNPRVAASRAGAQASRAEVAAARSERFPRISFAEAWQRSNQPVFVFGALLSSHRFAARNFAIDALNDPAATGLFHTTLAVDQLLFDGGRQQASADAATMRQHIADANVDETVASVVVSVTAAYGRLLAATAARRAADAAVAAAEEDRTRASRRRDAGTASDADVLALDVHLADVRQRAIQAASEIAIARAELNRLTGAPIDRACEAQEPAAGAPRASLPDAAALFAEADRSRPEIRRAEAAERLAAAARRQSYAAWSPQVVARGGYDLNGTTFGDRVGAWAVGGELRWTVGLGGAELASTRAAAEGLARARAERDDVTAAVHVEVVTALSRLQAAEARQPVARAAVEQARESDRIIRNRYDVGLASVNDLLRASTAVLDADAQRVSSVVDTLTSRAALDRALGRQP